MQAFGDRGLPATLVNGEVLTYSKYAAREELVAALGRSVERRQGGRRVLHAGRRLLPDAAAMTPFLFFTGKGGVGQDERRLFHPCATRSGREAHAGGEHEPRVQPG